MLNDIGIYKEDGVLFFILQKDTILSFQMTAKFSAGLLSNYSIGSSILSCIHADIQDNFNLYFSKFLISSEKNIIRWEETVLNSNYEFTLATLNHSDQILLTIREQNKLRQQEKLQEERELRLKKQSSAIYKISSSESLFDIHVEEAYLKVCKIAAETLEVKFIGLWLFEENDTKLHGKYLYDSSTGVFGNPIIIETSANPVYYEAILSNTFVAVKNTFEDHRMHGFYEYCQEFNIHALLDVPLLYKGKIIGVVCIEHVEKPRFWFQDEIDFAHSVASAVIILREAFERKLMLTQLEKVLRERNKMRRELEFEMERNQQLYESSGVGIALVQQDKIVDVNPKWLELFKSKNKNDFIGAHPADFSKQTSIEGKAAKEIFDEQAFFAFQQKFRQIEWDFLNFRKESIHTLMTLSSFRLRGESFLQLSIQDITTIHQYQLEIEQKNQQLHIQEEELKAYIEEINSIKEHTQTLMEKSEQELELIQSFLDSSSDIIIAWDIQFRFLHFNKAAKKAATLIGKPLITGGSVRELVNSDDWENIQMRTHEALKGNVIKAKTSIAGRPMSVIYNPLLNKNAEAWAVLVMFREEF